MYVADAKAAFAALGPRLAQIYGQGESPMTITAMNRALVADAIARGDDARLGSVGVAQTGIDVRVGDADDRAAARRRDRRSARARSDGDAGLLEEPRGEHARAGQRVAAHRRRRQPRRRRLPHAQGSLEGPDHQRRLEHLSARSRGGAAAAPRRRRGRRHRSPARRLGRGGDRLRRRPRRAARHPGSAARPACARSTRCASTTSRGSSGRRTTCFSTSCRRTTPARC